MYQILVIFLQQKRGRTSNTRRRIHAIFVLFVTDRHILCVIGNYSSSSHYSILWYCITVATWLTYPDIVFFLEVVNSRVNKYINFGELSSVRRSTGARLSHIPVGSITIQFKTECEHQISVRRHIYSQTLRVITHHIPWLWFYTHAFTGVYGELDPSNNETYTFRIPISHICNCFSKSRTPDGNFFKHRCHITQIKQSISCRTCVERMFLDDSKRSDHKHYNALTMTIKSKGSHDSIFLYLIPCLWHNQISLS